MNLSAPVSPTPDSGPSQTNTTKLLQLPLTLTDQEISETSRLLRDVWPQATHLTPEYLRWQYVANPIGKAIGYNAWDGTHLVGHYATIPVRALLFGEEKPGLLSLNTAVHKEYRGRDLFRRLALQTFDEAKAAGREFVVGVANQISTPLFKRYLKFKIIGPLQVKLSLSSVSLNLQKSLYNYYPVWDDELIEWRLQRPHTSYYTKKYFPGSPSSNMTVWAKTEQYGIHAQLGILPNNPALKAARILLTNPLKLWIGYGKIRSSFGSLASYNIPDKWKPSPLNFIFKELKVETRDLDPENILFQLADFDAY